MTCPFCGSKKILKDDPPLRGYVLLLLGILILFALRLIKPEAVSDLAHAQMAWIIGIGLAALAAGGASLFRHANRFCGTCGFRFRAVHQYIYVDREDEGQPSGRFVAAARQASGEALPERGDESNRHCGLPADTPIEPILACLKFKDPQQRKTAARTLAQLTGQDFGTDAAAWNAWWSENKVAYKEARHRAKTKS